MGTDTVRLKLSPGMNTADLRARLASRSTRPTWSSKLRLKYKDDTEEWWHFGGRRRRGRVSGGQLSNRNHPTPRALRGGDVEMKAAGDPILPGIGRPANVNVS